MKPLRKSWAAVLLCVGGVAVAQQPSAKLTFDAKGYEGNVRVDVQHVLQLRETARKAQDVIKLTCVNDKLIQIKALQKTFELKSSVDEPVLTDLAVDAEAIHNLRVEADQCVGEPEISSDSLNDYSGPQFPDDPTKGDPFSPDDGIEPPGYASPFS